jgi:hypothetical protein
MAPGRSNEGSHSPGRPAFLAMMLSQQCSTSGLRRLGHSIISNSNRGLQTAMLRPVEYIPERHHGKTLNPVSFEWVLGT